MESDTAQSAHLPSETVAWLRDNPWFVTDSELRAFAEQEHFRLALGCPNMTIADNLGRVTTLVRERYPDRVPDTGFLFHRDLYFIGAIPVCDVSEMAASRPFLATISFDTHATDGLYDLIWNLPLNSWPVPVPPRVLGELVAAIDGGKVVCIAAPSPASRDAARSAVLSICGVAGRA